MKVKSRFRIPINVPDTYQREKQDPEQNGLWSGSAAQDRGMDDGMFGEKHRGIDTGIDGSDGQHEEWRKNREIDEEMNMVFYGGMDK